jgi:hypothetical protein
MGAREDVLTAARCLEQRGITPWSPIQLIAEAKRLGSTLAESTLRTHVVSRMCADAPDHHGTVYAELERVGRGLYRLRR